MEIKKSMNFSFHFSSILIKRILAIVVLFNIFFLFGTWLHNSLLLANEWYVIPRLISLLNLADENNAAAWYSSMLLLIVALTAVFCFFVDSQRLKSFQDRVMNMGWLVLVMIFIILSFDEMGSFHETIGDTMLFKNMGSSHGAGWYAFYILIAVVGLFMVIFSLLKFKDNKKAFVYATIGVLFFASNPIQEIYEINSWKNSIDPDNWRRPMFFMLLEEGTEIFASFCFLKAFILYALHQESNNKIGLLNKGFSIKLIFKNFYIYLIAFIVCIGLLMIVIRMNAWQMEGDSGIAHNWFPSFMSLLVALLGSHLCFISHEKTPNLKKTLVLFTFYSLLMSAFYGCNIYAVEQMPLNKLPIIFLCISVIVIGLAIMKLEGSITKIGLVVGILCIVISYYFRDFKSAMFGYLAASFFLFSLSFYYQQLTKKLKSNI